MSTRKLLISTLLAVAMMLIVLVGLSSAKATEASSADVIGEASVIRATTQYTPTVVKTASPDVVFPGDEIVYTIFISSPVTTTVRLYDAIPEHTVYVTHTVAERIVGTVVLPGDGTLSNLIYFEGQVGTLQLPGITVTLTVRVDDGVPAGTEIENTAMVWYDSEGPVESTATTTVWGRIFLPLVMKNYS